MKIKKSDLQNSLNQLFQIEIDAVKDTLDQSRKENTVDYFKQHAIMAQSYLKGIERAAEIVSIILREVMDEED